MTTWLGIGLAVAALYALLNRMWKRTVGATPVDPDATGDLEELVGNAGGIIVGLLAIIAAVVALAVFG
jgi:hypothetical protein